MRIGDSTTRDGRLGTERSRARGGEAPRSAHPREGAKPDDPSAFARVLRRLGHEVDVGERVVRRAVGAGGQALGPTELLALQAGIYRYSEAVDLSAKLVDRATSGIKTVLQGQ